MFVKFSRGLGKVTVGLPVKKKGFFLFQYTCIQYYMGDKTI